MKYPGYILLLWLAVIMPLPPASADARPPAFSIEEVSTELKDGVYLLNARLRLALSEQVQAALRNGVTLVILVDIDISRPRRFWLDERIVTLAERFELGFHALTRQYLVRNLNTGIQESFHSLAAALDHISRIDALPFLDADLLEPGKHYTAGLRVSLDLESLPLALKVKAYTKSAWRTSSPWVYRHMP